MHSHNNKPKWRLQTSVNRRKVLIECCDNFREKLVVLLNCFASYRGVIFFFFSASSHWYKWHWTSECKFYALAATSWRLMLCMNLCWHYETAPDIFLLIYFSKRVHVLKLFYTLSTFYMFVCFKCVRGGKKEALSFICRRCHTAALVSLIHFSSASVFFLFCFFIFTLFNVVSLPFVSAASGACLGKTSCVTRHPPTIRFSIHLQTRTHKHPHTHTLTPLTFSNMTRGLHL